MEVDTQDTLKHVDLLVLMEVGSKSESTCSVFVSIRRAIERHIALLRDRLDVDARLPGRNPMTEDSMPCDTPCGGFSSYVNMVQQPTIRNDNSISLLHDFLLGLSVKSLAPSLPPVELVSELSSRSLDQQKRARKKHSTDTVNSEHAFESKVTRPVPNFRLL